MIIMAFLATCFMLCFGFANYCVKNKFYRIVFLILGWVLFGLHSYFLQKTIDDYSSKQISIYFLYLFAQLVAFIFLFRKFDK